MPLFNDNFATVFTTGRLKFFFWAGQTTVVAVATGYITKTSVLPFGLTSKPPSFETTIAVLGFFGTLIGAYLAFVAIKDARNNKLYDEFREYITSELSEVKILLDRELSLQQEEIKVLREKVIATESRVFSHEDSFGHKRVVDLVMEIKNDYSELKILTERIAKDHEIASRIEKLEAILLQGLSENLFRDKPR